MTVGGHGSPSPPPAPLSVGYCVYSRGALLSSHLPSPLPMGGEQLSWNHWTGESLVWLAAHLVLGDPCQAPGLGGGGGKRPASLGVFGGRPATQRGHRLQRGGYEAPPALGTSCGGAGVAKSGCRGWDLASRRLGPSLHSGLSCTKKERGLWARGQEPQRRFSAGPSLRSSDWGRGGLSCWGQSLPGPLPLRGSRALPEAITAPAASTPPPCLPHAWAPSQLAAWLTPNPHLLPLAPFSLPLLAFLKTGLGRPWGGWRSS